MQNVFFVEIPFFGVRNVVNSFFFNFKESIEIEVSFESWLSSANNCETFAPIFCKFFLFEFFFDLQKKKKKKFEELFKKRELLKKISCCRQLDDQPIQNTFFFFQNDLWILKNNFESKKKKKCLQEHWQSWHSTVQRLDLWNHLLDQFNKRETTHQQTNLQLEQFWLNLNVRYFEFTIWLMIVFGCFGWCEKHIIWDFDFDLVWV